MNLLKLAEIILEHTKKPQNGKEIWDNAQKHSKELQIKDYIDTIKGETPWATIDSNIYVDIKNSNSIFYKYDKGKFYLKKYRENKTEISFNKFNERDLHPLLAKFADIQFKAHLKTIYHEKSDREKKGMNKWLHPDQVGVCFPFINFENATLKLQEKLYTKPIKLFSFEIKTELNLRNLREFYFQAVSNSSWADEGYLVTLNMSNDPDFVNELRLLNNAFGIGIIKLNQENIYDSEILYPSKINPKIDWDMINRLQGENPDFEKFLTNIKDSITINKITGDYDEIFDEEEFKNHVNKKFSKQQIESYKKTTENKKLTKLQESRLNFWNRFKQYSENKGTKMRLRNPLHTNWYGISIGSSLAHIVLDISESKNIISCYISIPNSKELYNKLFIDKENIEQEINEKLKWNKCPELKTSYIQVSKNYTDVTDADNWEDCFEWMKTISEKFYEVFPKYIK